MPVHRKFPWKLIFFWECIARWECSGFLRWACSISFLLRLCSRRWPRDWTSVLIFFGNQTRSHRLFVRFSTPLPCRLRSWVDFAWWPPIGTSAGISTGIPRSAHHRFLRNCRGPTIFPFDRCLSVGRQAHRHFMEQGWIFEWWGSPRWWRNLQDMRDLRRRCSSWMRFGCRCTAAALFRWWSRAGFGGCPPLCRSLSWIIFSREAWSSRWNWWSLSSFACLRRRLFGSAGTVSFIRCRSRRKVEGSGTYDKGPISMPSHFWLQICQSLSFRTLSRWWGSSHRRSHRYRRCCKQTSSIFQPIWSFWFRWEGFRWYWSIF